MKGVEISSYITYVINDFVVLYNKSVSIMFETIYNNKELKAHTYEARSELQEVVNVPTKDVV